MSLIGKESTNPVIFYSGKIAGYILWVLFVLTFINILNIQMIHLSRLNHMAYVAAAAGSIFTILSFFNLGTSTRLGLPAENTEFKDGGLYKISRNPMYVGFNLFTLASMLLTANIATLSAGIYSILTYHLIIRGEEAFLEKRFGERYLTYKNKVRRYL